LNEGASRKSAGRLGRKTERGRKPETSWKAGRKDRPAAQVAGWCQGRAGRLAEDASRRLAGRRAVGKVANASWRLTRGQVEESDSRQGSVMELEGTAGDRQLTQVGGRLEGETERLIAGANRRLAGG